VVGYHNYPPCLSTVLLESPTAIPGDGKDNDRDGTIDEPGEVIGMSKFMSYNNTADMVNGNPYNYLHYYNLLSGNWKDGGPLTYGANGLGGTVPTSFLYSGDSDPLFYGTDGVPVANNWTEGNAGNAPGDRRYILGSGPLRLNAKDTIRLLYAIVFTQDSSVQGNNLSSVYKNEQEVKLLKQWYQVNKNNLSCEGMYAVGLRSVINNSLNVKLFPNPNSGILYIQIPQTKSVTTMEVFDALGKSIHTSILSDISNTISTQQWGSGMYFIKIRNTEGQKTFKLIKE